MSVLKSQAQYEKEVKALGISVKGLYAGSHTKIEHVCACGNTFQRSPTGVLSGHVHCRECSNAQLYQTRTATERDRYDKKLKRVRPEYKRVGEYVDGYTPLKHRCKHHGLFSCTPNSLLYKSAKPRCPQCMEEDKADRVRKNAVTLEKFLERIEGLPVEFVGVVKSKRSSIKRVHMKCPEHGIYEANQISVYHGARYHGCAKCAIEKGGKEGYRRKVVKRGRKTFSLQGYEHHALDWLIAKFGVGRIEPGISQPIPYKWRGKQRLYYPDFIVGDNVVEVKSTYTLAANPSVLSRNKAKAKAVKKMQLNFRLLVFADNGNKLPIPRDWTTMSCNGIKQHFSESRNT